MVFSSTVFLFVFLPAVFVLHQLMPNRVAKNVLLTAASLVFYAFGEPVVVLLMLASAFVNYALARLFACTPPAGIFFLSLP